MAAAIRFGLVAALLAAPSVTLAQAPASTGVPTSATTAVQHSDSSLQDRIAFRIDTSASLRKYDVKVKVDNGVATLSGDVATAAQKAEAARLANVPGITKVNNDLKVSTDTDKTLMDRTKSGLSKTGEKIDDAWITTKVKWFFIGEDALKGSDIDVDTSQNVVTLKGTVASAAGKARAEELARDTEGVKRVVNTLTIGPKK